MKKIKLLGLLFTLILLIACSNTNIENENSIRITEEEIEYQLSFIPEKYRVNYSMEELRKEIKESLIEQKLFEAEAISLNYHKDIDFMREVENIKREILISRLIDDKIIKSTKVSDEEIKDFYNENLEDFKRGEEVRARHILIDNRNLNDKEKLEGKERAYKILEKALKGEDFALLAIEHSQGPTGPQGGDLGWFSRGQMIKEFEEAAFSGKKGVYPEIVETIYGYHIIYIEDISEKSYIPYDSIEEKLKEELLNRKRYELYLSYIEELKEKYRIEN